MNHSFRFTVSVTSTFRKCLSLYPHVLYVAVRVLCDGVKFREAITRKSSLVYSTRLLPPPPQDASISISFILNKVCNRWYVNCHCLKLWVWLSDLHVCFNSTRRTWAECDVTWTELHVEYAETSKSWLRNPAKSHWRCCLSMVASLWPAVVQTFSLEMQGLMSVFFTFLHEDCCSL